MLIAIGWPLVQALPIAHSSDPESFQARLIAFATSFVGMVAAVVIRLVVFRFFGLCGLVRVAWSTLRWRFTR